MEAAIKLDRPIAELSDTELSLEKAKTNKKYTLDQLLKVEFSPLEFYVDRLITSGLTLLWGAAKSGKSLLVLGFLLSISAGGKALGCLSVKLTEVLYISLEDGPRRLQKRLLAAGAESNENFHLCFDWKRGDEGIIRLSDFLENNPLCKVVVIDTLALFSRMRDSNDYSETTRIMETLKKIADDKDVCIIVIHHSKKTRKDFSGNILETALGSTGIVSGPDHLICLTRTPSGPSDAVLHFISKDAEPAELALNFDADLLSWKYAGEAEDIAATNERQEIIDLLKANGAMSTGDIGKALDKKVAAVSRLLKRLAENGKVKNISYGVYGLIEHEQETAGGKETPLF